MEATLNVRLGKTLKDRGDKVLKDSGISASAAVRGLWEEMARTRALPAFLQDAAGQAVADKKKVAALGALQGVARGGLSELSDEQLRQVGMQRYE